MTQSAPTFDPVADLPAIIASVARKEMILVDVRGIQEVEVSGIAQGAIHIPLLQIPAMADPASPECLDVFKLGLPVALYCATGVRSGKAAQQLQEYGHAYAVNIGGLKDWTGAGGPLA